MLSCDFFKYTLISSASPDDTLGTLQLLTRYLKKLEKDHSFGKSEEVVSNAITYIGLLHKNYKKLLNRQEQFRFCTSDFR